MYTLDNKAITKKQAGKPLSLSVFLAGLAGLMIGSFAMFFVANSMGKQRAASSTVVSPATVNTITPEVLFSSQFSGPYLLTVLLPDGSFSYATVDRGTLVDDVYKGDVRLRYPNGEWGVVNDDGTGEIPFYTRLGEKVQALIVDRLVSGVGLPDGVILPVKFIRGSIGGGSITGIFRMVTYAEKREMTGEFSSRGSLVSIRVDPTLYSFDATSVIVIRELLKLVYELALGDKPAVLGISDPATENTSVFGTSGVAAPIFSAFSYPSTLFARRYAKEGVIRLFP